MLSNPNIYDATKNLLDPQQVPHMTSEVVGISKPKHWHVIWGQVDNYGYGSIATITWNIFYIKATY